MADQKQWWAPVRKGLVMDKPAHRKRMGSAVWLFLYLLMNANRRTGALFRKIKTVAGDMETTRDTVMRWLVILREGGYIATTSTGRCLSIQINKWRPSEGAGIRQKERRMYYPRGWGFPENYRSAEPRNDANISGKNTEAVSPNDNYIKKNLLNDIVLESQVRTFKEFIPEDKKGLLAVDLADALNDRDNLPLYLYFARRYPEQILRSVLGEVKDVALTKIKKSRAALFNHLIQEYAKQAGRNSQD